MFRLFWVLYAFYRHSIGILLAFENAKSCYSRISVLHPLLRLKCRPPSPPSCEREAPALAYHHHCIVKRVTSIGTQHFTIVAQNIKSSSCQSAAHPIFPPTGGILIVVILSNHQPFYVQAIIHLTSSYQHFLDQYAPDATLKYLHTVLSSLSHEKSSEGIGQRIVAMKVALRC